MKRVLQEYPRASRESGANGATGSLKDQDLCPELTSRQRKKCPWCQKRMVVRRDNRLNLFWSCSRFPICEATRPINQERFAAYLASRRSKTG